MALVVYPRHLPGGGTLDPSILFFKLNYCRHNSMKVGAGLLAFFVKPF